MAGPADEHRAQAEGAFGIALVTVSTSRARANDLSGDVMARLTGEAGHRVVERMLIPDDPSTIREAAQELLGRADVDAVILSGGTGLSPGDVTIEAVTPLFTRPLPAFAALFAQLSYAQVGAAAMLSGAAAGLVGPRQEGTEGSRTQTSSPAKAVFCLPGSPKAVALALEKLILPELGHLLGQARRVR